MKISDITLSFVKEYLKLEFDDDDDDLLLSLMMDSTKSHIKKYTGIKLDADLDEAEDLTLVYLVLVSEMHGIRSYSVDKDKVNKLVDNILNTNSFNLL